MSDDASFKDGEKGPLALIAADAEDLKVVSAMVQDAVLMVSDVNWQPRKRQAAFLLNRFRWEDRAEAERLGRAYERVRALLVVDDALRMQANGIVRDDPEMVLSLLSITFTEGDTPQLLLTFAGYGEIALKVEAVNLTLKDVTRPYQAPSRKAPVHPDS